MLHIAIYHFNVKVVSRGKNASAVAKAAYISGEKIKNSYDGVTHDYRKKKEIVHKEILLPSNAPPEFMKRAVLWNSVEQAEKRKNSQTAKHIDAALPVEISRDEQIDLVRNFCLQCFVSKGMCADFAIHDKGDGNPHVHILLTTRRVDENGFTVKDRSWNDKSLLLEWRKLWADWCNHKLYAVSDERIDHRSYAAQGIDKIPQMHLGAAACAIEKKGYRTDKGSRNRKIIFANCKAEIVRLESELAYLSEERNKLNKEIIENIVGCPFSEMRMFHYTSDYIQAVEQELIKRGARCVRTKVDDVTDKVFFSATNAEIFTEVQNYLHSVYEAVPTINGREASWLEMIAEYERKVAENIKTHNNAPSEQNQDKPLKKHRSL